MNDAEWCQLERESIAAVYRAAGLLQIAGKADPLEVAVGLLAEERAALSRAERLLALTRPAPPPTAPYLPPLPPLPDH